MRNEWYGVCGIHTILSFIGKVEFKVDLLLVHYNAVMAYSFCSKCVRLEKMYKNRIKKLKVFASRNIIKE